MRTQEFSEGFGSRESEQRKILVVTEGSRFTTEIIHYAIHLAGRVDCSLLLMNVFDDGLGASTLAWEKSFTREAMQSAMMFRRQAAQSGIACDHVMRLGYLARVVEEINRHTRRIAFVVCDSEAIRREIGIRTTLPVFGVSSKGFSARGEDSMGQEQRASRRKTVGKVMGYGLMSAALYAGVFLNSDSVMGAFTKGGWYAAMPIATVFAFSFVHGAFASSLWSLLGIEAMKRTALRETEKKVLEKRKQARKRPRAYAYVNPFHRI